MPSLVRILLGFAIATSLGIGFGVPLGLWGWSRRFAMPHIEYLRAMPPPALLPISVVLLHSIGNVPKICLIAFVCFFPILLNTIDGVRGDRPDARWRRPASYGIPAGRPDASGSCCPRRRRRSRRHADRALARGDHHGRQPSTVSSTSGVGYVHPHLAAHVPARRRCGRAILLIGVLGYLLNVVYLLVERRVLAWHRGWRAASPQ